jgi:hypothetical protein
MNINYVHPWQVTNERIGHPPWQPLQCHVTLTFIGASANITAMWTLCSLVFFYVQHVLAASPVGETGVGEK